MNIAVGFGCLVSVAVLIGLPELVKCTVTCSCDYVHRPNKGCKLSKQNPAEEGMACRCIEAVTAGTTNCTGTVLACTDPSSTNCTSDSIDFNRCMQGVYDGKGNCCGYPTPHNPCKNVGGQNTRIFGALGNLATSLAGGALGALGGAQQSFQQRPHHHHQQGFNPGFQQGFQGQVGGFPGQVGGFQGQVGGFPGQVGGFQGGVGGGIGQFGGGVGSSGSISCRRWCRTPQGQAYCCESGDEPLTHAVVKPGQCPPIRPQCPPTRFHNPTRCSSDGACVGHDKCCFDTCLQHHTCKPPIGLGK